MRIHSPTFNMKVSVALFFLASLALLSSAQDTNLTGVKQAMLNANVPQDATLNFDPSVLFEVAYPQTDGSFVNITAGNTIAQDKISQAPVFGLQSSTRNITEKYVIAIIDIGSPNTTSEVRQYLGGNFMLQEVDDSGFGQLENTTAALTEYGSPSAQADDPHRIACFLFVQSGIFNFQKELNATTPTTPFNLSQIASDFRLGDPIGATFFWL